MPIRKVKGGFKWGGHGHVYPTREGAEKQAAAAHAHGYHEDGYDAAQATMEHLDNMSPDPTNPGEGCGY